MAYAGPLTIVKDIPSAGTAVALASSTTLCKQVVIQGKDGNTGVVYIGDSTVDSSNGIALGEGEIITLTAPRGGFIDLSLIYADAGTNGDDVLALALI